MVFSPPSHVNFGWGRTIRLARQTYPSTKLYSVTTSGERPRANFFHGFGPDAVSCGYHEPLPQATTNHMPTTTKSLFLYDDRSRSRKRRRTFQAGEAPCRSALSELRQEADTFQNRTRERGRVGPFTSWSCNAIQSVDINHILPFQHIQRWYNLRPLFYRG